MGGSMLIEPITNLSFVGIYVLLLFSLAFHFLLGQRIRGIQQKVLDYEGSTDKQLSILKERMDLLEETVGKLT
jgi:hypothetical protein